MQTQAQTQTSANPVQKPASLIGSDRVEGTAVYRSNGGRIGTIKRLMIEKKRGQVAYAVLSFGGILGFGDNYYPIPWDLLTFNERLGGYVVDISDAQLKGAPKFAGEDWDSGDRTKERVLFDYYGIGPY